MEHKIRILSDEIANKIAAGEVVQRPLSVVKELVENSIDAKSAVIKIELKGSGLDEIKVTDDGIGMSKENVELCLTRHATSKVLNEEDIYKIMTLGFRGEALASISSVSQFSLLTSTDGIEGYELIKNGDEPSKITSTSTNKGTIISVKNLFFNTPARHKHLSSTFYELSLIIQYINKAALTNPSIKIELINNENSLFSSLGDGNIINVMQKIYNSEIAKNILTFEAENNHFKIEAYIVKPQITRSKKNNMHIAVNDRTIKNIAIENMILKGYGQYLHTGQFPIVFINIYTDYSLIDINIHPTKEQIKISLINQLEKLITTSIKDKLNEVEYISKPNIDQFKVNDFVENTTNVDKSKQLTKQENENLDNLFSDKKEQVNKESIYKNIKEDKIDIVQDSKDSKVKTSLDDGSVQNYILEENTSDYLTEPNKLDNSNISTNSNNEGTYKDFFEDFNLTKEQNITNKTSPKKVDANENNDKTSISKDDIKINDVQYETNTLIKDVSYNQTLVKNGKFIGIFHKTYILYESENGIYFIDQHAAQERIRYEQILNNFKNKKFNLQRVLIPQIYDFTTSEYLLISQKLEDFESVGLNFEKFGPNTLRLVEADSWYLKTKNLENQIRNIIDLILKGNKLSFDKIIDEIAISIACKGSIKANDYITPMESEDLLVQLSSCKEPYTCPHGRPIIVNLEQYQIQKMFKRVT